jgi:uncharacterized repeat protein (TIGR03803 family)
MFEAKAPTIALLCAATFAATAAPAHGARYKQLYAFQGGNDGALPQTGLTMVNGTLYGVTLVGGGAPICDGVPSGCGTLYSINPMTGAGAVVHSFGYGHDVNLPRTSLIGVSGLLIGVASSNSIYSVDISTGADTVLYTIQYKRRGDGISGSLLKVGNTFYDTTYNGGHGYDGVVFSLKRNFRHETALWLFHGNHNHLGDGEHPDGGVIEVGGTLYGTTVKGGKHNRGTVFSVNTTTGAETVVYSLGGHGDGAFPRAGLLNVDGILYGTTYQGGADDIGTVFSVNPATGVEAVVYSFQGNNDGAYPEAGLTKVDDKLYGTTNSGGAHNYGTVFEVKPATDTESVKYSFKGGADGVNPQASLLNVGGTLYGTTYEGGDSACQVEGCGTVFAYTP